MADKTIFGRIGDWLTGESAEPIDDLGAELIEPPEETIEKAKAAVPTNTIGSNDIGDVGGYVFDDLERVPDLIGDRRFITFDRMVKDTSIIAAGVRLFLNLLANADWSVSPPDDQKENPQAQEIADLCYDILFDMTTSWSTVVRKTALYRFQGFALLEWTAKMRDDGNVGLLDIENRPQRTIARWLRDASGTVVAVMQRLAKGGEVEIPRAKMVYAVDDTLSDSPEGMGLFRHLAVMSDRLRQFLELEMIGYETDLRGIPIARAPLGELRKEVKDAGGGDAQIKAEARRQTMLKPLKDFVQKHIRNKKTGLLLPSDTYVSPGNDSITTTSVPKWGLELLTGDSTSFPDIAKAIVRMNEEMARVLGVEHLLLGTGGTGSLALAQSKVGTFYLTITSTLLDLVEIFERDIIMPLATLNGWPEEMIPTLGVSEISDMDIEVVTRALAALATAGATMLPTDPAIVEIYERLGLTPPPPEERQAALDASLNANRNDPKATNPNDPMAANPEDQVAKRRILKSRRAMAATARMKKAA